MNFFAFQCSNKWSSCLFIYTHLQQNSFTVQFLRYLDSHYYVFLFFIFLLFEQPHISHTTNTYTRMEYMYQIGINISLIKIYAFFTFLVLKFNQFLFKVNNLYLLYIKKKLFSKQKHKNKTILIQTKSLFRNYTRYTTTIRVWKSQI